MVHSAERIALAERLVSVAQTYFPAIDGTAVPINTLPSSLRLAATRFT